MQRCPGVELYSEVQPDAPRRYAHVWGSRPRRWDSVQLNFAAHVGYLGVDYLLRKLGLENGSRESTGVAAFNYPIDDDSTSPLRLSTKMCTLSTRIADVNFCFLESYAPAPQTHDPFIHSKGLSIEDGLANNQENWHSMRGKCH